MKYNDEDFRYMVTFKPRYTTPKNESEAKKSFYDELEDAEKDFDKIVKDPNFNPEETVIGLYKRKGEGWEKIAGWFDFK